MSASGRLYFAVSELVYEGLQSDKIADIISRDYGVSRDYVFRLIDSIREEY